MLLAGLRRRDRAVGLLAIRWRLPNACFDTDRDTIDSFLALVSATALHSEFFRHQQDLLRDAERRTALGNLARAISHDLSNSFGVIQPLLDTLRREANAGTLDRADLIRDLDTLERYVTASVRIFRGLLSFAHGSVEEAQSLEIEGCLDEVLSLLDRGLKTSGIEVVQEIPPDLPRLYARRQEIEQLFLNLLTNAKESMPEGGRLTIRAWLENEGTDQTIGLSIADTGRGIRAEDLPRVFEPFYSTKQGGTGLGLDICRSIVWEYDGGLWLDSDVGRGTVVQVRLPVRGLSGKPSRG
ncbi:MAG: hypothetical protein GF346_05875 [Candidatus Eisenbacteria bacterium]|nr:hypothetical protein [Candidatus Latescibacterota bacterium]MBD3301957.1 hypothetical protein [Candidatus Eisenbacteria bacterium]